MSTKPTKFVSVVVSDEDIMEGSEASPWHCPVALAIERATGMRASVSVTMAWLAGRDWTAKEAIHLPEKISARIRELDGYGDVAREEWTSYPLDSPERAFDIEIAADV